MFIDDLPIYVPQAAGPLSAVGEQVTSLLLLPGSITDYPEADQQLLQRMMSALGIPETSYQIIFLPDKVQCRLTAVAGSGQTRQVINMGIGWDRLGLHVELPLYHAALVGNWVLVAADPPAMLAKDGQLKKQLWDQLMRMHQLSQS
jgi:hypothetical protein